MCPTRRRAPPTASPPDPRSNHAHRHHQRRALNPSATRLLADRLGHAAQAQTGASIETVELRELAHPLADNLVTGFASGDLAAAIDKVRAADALIAVTPVFSASYSGLFKTFFDVLEPGMLEGKPVLMAATAGTARHSLVLEHAMRPLFSHLRAVPVPTAVFAATEDFGDTHAGALQARIDRAAAQLAALADVGQPSTLAHRAQPAQGPVFDEQSEGFVDFESLLSN